MGTNRFGKCLECDLSTTRGFFISHSNRDIEKVSEIRNELERRGHNPVLFFLKCMETTEADDRLLWQLIEREIKAREWFILCDSPNARNSAAVLREMELVKSMAREGKVVETLDLGRGLETEIHKVIRLSMRATVFLSYASADRATADAIRRALMRHEFTVTSPEHFGASAQPIQDVIGAVINEAVERGFVPVLLSPPGCGGVAAKQRPSFPFPMAAAALAREAARWRLPGLACASFCRMAFLRLRIPLKTSPLFGVI